MDKNSSIRKYFVTLAYAEGRLSAKGNENKAGINIEKYLAVFRKTLASRNPKYLNKQVGFEWCCAYVYYLLKKVKYKIDIFPLTNDWHLASVRTWYEWALKSKYFVDNMSSPLPGDLVLFSYLIESVELDHIGIVIENYENSILTSEGNYYNCSGVFEREKDNTIKGYIRLWS